MTTEYNQKYYRLNKDRLSRLKKERYRQDKAYREKVLSKAMLQYWTERLNAPPVDAEGQRLWTMKEVASALKKDYRYFSITVNDYYPPKATYRRKFTSRQVEMLKVLYSMHGITYPMIKEILPKFWDKKPSEYTLEEVIEYALEVKRKSKQSAVLSGNNHEHGKLRKRQDASGSGEDLSD